jgi:hypothetical protein
MMNFHVTILVQTQQGESAKDICIAIENAIKRFSESDCPEMEICHITVSNGVVVE